jgi:hypothetical protein
MNNRTDYFVFSEINQENLKYLSLKILAMTGVDS